MKYLNKQGPIYIRAVSDIPENNLSDDSSNISDKEDNFTVESDDDDILLVPTFKQGKLPGTNTLSSDEVQEVDQVGASTIASTSTENARVNAV